MANKSDKNVSAQHAHVGDDEADRFVNDSIVITGSGNVIHIDDSRKSRKKNSKTPFHRILIYIAQVISISISIGLIVNLISSLPAIMEIFNAEFVKESLRVVTIIFLLIMVALLITFIVMVYYQQRITQTEEVIKKLHEKETDYFEGIETDFSSILNEKVQ